jgi:fibronectin type 3 domain-containing protein
MFKGNWFKQLSHVYLVVFVVVFALAGTITLLKSFGATPTATTTSTRNPLLWPFTSTSIWNMPIGTGAAYVPSQIATPTISAMTTDITNILMTPTDPLTAIEQGPQAQSGNRCQTGGSVLATVPIAASFVLPNDTHNEGFAAVGSDGSALVEGGRFARCTAGQPATASDAKAVGTIYGAGLTGSSGGSGLSVLGGVLRPGDLAPGTETRHALSININGETDLWRSSASTCFMWPATRCDGYGPQTYGGQNPALRMGGLLAIPQNLSLSSLGLTTQAGQELAWTLQNYGGYVVNDTTRSVFATRTDSTNSFVNQFQTEWGFPFETSGVSGSGWTADVMKIIAHLDVITNNGPSSIGGGGTPLQPLAPPLGTGTQGNPTISITAPTNGATVTAQVPVSAVATDSQPITQVVFYAGANSIGTDTSSPYSVSWDTTKVANGSIVLKAVVTDKTGQSASSSETVTVNNSGPPPPPSTKTFYPAGDSYVTSAYPTANNSQSTILGTEGNPVIRSFLKFNVQVSGTITKAVLRVYANTIVGGKGSYAVHTTSSDWEPATLNYRHMPELGTKIGSSDSIGANSWGVADVTSGVKSNGTYSFAMVNNSNNRMIYNSTRAKSNQPQLVITYGSSCGSSCTNHPAAPTNLTGSAISSTQVNLSWTASTSSNVTHYNVYRDNTVIANPTGTSYNDTSASASTTYTYSVTAVNSSSLESTQSNTISVATPPYPPAAPTNLTGSAISSTQVNLSWTASTSSNVTHYNVFRDNTVIANPTGTSYNDTSASASTTYTYAVTAVNSSSLESTQSNTISVTTPPSTCTPTTPPTVPTGLTGTPISTTQINVAWNASTDTCGTVAGYYVFRDGTKVATVTTGVSYGDSQLTAATTYTYYVEAFNTAGNISAASATISATTLQVGPPPQAFCNGTAPPTYTHIIWIIMENKGYNATLGSGAATYWTKLSQACSTAKAAYGITHPSLPNYIALTSGSPQGTNDGNKPPLLGGASIFSAAAASGKTWKTYQENMTSNCQLNGGPGYDLNHAPAPFYITIEAACAADDVPFGSTTSGAFLNDLNNNTLPNFAEVTPNLIDDMHDGTVQQGDAWLALWMPIIQKSASYKAGNTAVFLMMDESVVSSEGNRVPFVVVAPSVKAGTVVTTTLNHYNILRTTEDLLGISPPLGGAASASDISSQFNL